MNADLHCHSTVSDGSLAPAAVVERAVARGVELLALTDHDEVGGVAEAAARAAELGLGFLAGVEISVSWEAHSIHVVGLGVDARDPVLLRGLQAQRDGRQLRAERMGAALERLAVADALAGARRFADNPELVGRAHFARHLVACGLAKDVASVFLHYLKPGKPGYVEHQWVGPDEAVAWIRGAGGIAVLAHPSRYRLGAAELERLAAAFRAAGGEGVEVVSGADEGKVSRAAAGLARRFGFLASRASDFHDEEESACDLGGGQPLPPDLTPVWTRFDVSQPG